MPTQTTSHTITLDNLRLAYTVAGHPDAPPLLMVHGWLSFRGVWRQTIPALQEQYYCVALDLPGFGDSDKPPDADYSLPAQGRRVLQVADALGFDRFTLMGHSMGGQISLCIASMLAPQRVARLVSVAGVVAGRLMPRIERIVYPSIALGAVIPRAFFLARWLLRYEGFVRFNYAPWFYDMDSLPFDAWEADRIMSIQPGIQIPAYKAGQAIHELDLTSHLHKITAPTLAISGRQEGTVPVSDAQLIQDRVPNSCLVWIDDCGHFPMYEQTARYLEAVQDFLVP